MNRRNFLRLAGGGLIVAATAATVYGCTGFGVPDSAIAAWDQPGAGGDLRHWVLAHALLAPNPHNMQPWIVDLGRDQELILRLDAQRLLPATDPYGRQILMGCGGFLELLDLAASTKRQRSVIELFPEGEPTAVLDSRPIARIRLISEPLALPDPLFDQVLLRRTDRRPYLADRRIAAAHGAVLKSAVAGLPLTFGLAGLDVPDDQIRVRALREIAQAAWRIELNTERVMMETMRVLRFGSAEIDAHRDGLNITSPVVVMMKRLGIFDPNTYPGPSSTAMIAQVKDFAEITAATPGYVWLATTGNQRAQQIAAGRAYARLNLAATGVGLAMHPNSQALQEYPEMAGQFTALHRLLEAPNPEFTVQMLARIGYLAPDAAPLGPAPRRGVEALFPG